MCVDSVNSLHVLTNNSVYVFSNRGELINEYSFLDEVTEPPLRITTSYNREVIYINTPSQVIKYFRNGAFFGFLANNLQCVTNISGVYQDEYRSTLIASGDKIVKYADLMTTKSIKGNLPTTYRALTDLFIHKEEYIQSWVYTRSFQKLWDNIEIFRHALIFDNSTFCKQYVPPKHNKNKLIVGQNEIVTSSVINRNINYLWDNFLTLLNYFDPKCTQSIEEKNL